MDEKVPFRINHPLDILMKSKKINFNNKHERERIFRRNLFYYKYGKKKNNFLEERYKIYFLLAKEVLKFMDKNYPSLNILSVSIFGSSLFSKNPMDFDFLVIVKGNIFLLKETEFILKKNEKTTKYPVGISIKGEDNFTYGIFDFQSKTSIDKQSQIIDRTSISLFKRHIPIIGYDFIENKNVFIDNVYAQVSDLLSNTYNLYYLKKEKLSLDDQQRTRKILSRLYEAASYLEFLEKDSEIKEIRREMYLSHEKKNTSFLKSKKFFDRFKLLYINKSHKLKKRISKEMSFGRDKIEFDQILKKTKNFLSKKRIGKFLPVMAKIVDSKGNTIAFSKRIKQSNGLKTGSGPIHAEICAIYNAKSKKKINWGDYTLYCSLEPCGACTKIIAELGIKKVVYCLADPLLSHYGRERNPYLRKNILFYRHNSPEIIAEFQKIYKEVYNKASSKEVPNVLEVLLNKKLKENIAERLKEYWKRIGLPYKWIPPILNILLRYYYNKNLSIGQVRKRFPSLTKKDSLDYSKKLLEWRKEKIINLSKRVNNYVSGEIIADIGGRTDDFIEQILTSNKFIKKAYVTDIESFPTKSKNHKINFVVQPTNTKLPFAKNSIDTIILSMVLHHLKNSDQKKLVKNIISLLNKNGIIILIEDTFPESKEVKGCNKNINKFLKFNPNDKMKILSFYDWFGNKLMRNRNDFLLTFNYKTMEKWKIFFERFGMTQTSSEFVKENYLNLDLFPPKAVMVFKKM